MLIYRVVPAVDRWLERIPPPIADMLCLAMAAQSKETAPLAQVC